MIVLSAREGDGEAREHRIGDGVYVIGRDPKSDIVLKHSTVARKHARLTVDSTRCLIEDLASTSGMVVGGERVTRADLSVGDTVSLGLTSLTVVEIVA